MKSYTNFFELYSEEYNIFNIFAMNQRWKNNSEFTMKYPRPTNALLLFSGCHALYEEQETGNVLTIPKDSLFFVPAGTTYRWKFFTDSQQISTMLFEFSLKNSQDQVIRIDKAASLISEEATKTYQPLFSDLIEEFSKPLPSSARVKAAAYAVFAAVTKEGRRNVILKHSASCIYQGIRYLENNPEQSKSIAEIAEMCHVSINYFERLFKEYTGDTPSAYRLKKKIERAKLMLASETRTVQQIATDLGFEDCAYFCRVFKRYCGCTPTSYRAQNPVQSFS